MDKIIGFCHETRKCRRCKKPVGYNGLKPHTALTYCNECIDRDDLPDIWLCPICDGEEYTDKEDGRMNLRFCSNCNGIFPIGLIKKTNNGE